MDRAAWCLSANFDKISSFNCTFEGELKVFYLNIGLMSSVVFGAYYLFYEQVTESRLGAILSQVDSIIEYTGDRTAPRRSIIISNVANGSWTLGQNWPGAIYFISNKFEPTIQAMGNKTALLQPCKELMCYVCDSRQSPACGAYFKPYQFQTAVCDGENPKCALQRQTNADGWNAIIRTCYTTESMGSPWINDSNGCHEWVHHEDNFTVTFCFCNENYCNKATSSMVSISVAVYLLTLLAQVLQCI